MRLAKVDPGCTDHEACNYNSNNATVEDGSCIYEGCACKGLQSITECCHNRRNCNGELLCSTSWVGDDDCVDNNYMFNEEELIVKPMIDANEDGYCENIEDLSGFVLISFFCEDTSYDEGDYESLNLNNPITENIKTH